MSYNYPQPQYQAQQFAGYSGYKPTPQYPQWTQPAAPTLPQVRPVSSIEEVRACPIDFDGSVFYFADVANKRIYTKQINMDGTATINLYELKIPTQADQSATSFVTRQEFEQVINQLKEMYNKSVITPVEKVIESKMEETEQPAAQPKAQFSF